MANRLLIQPPEILEVDGKVVFLGGPIQGAPDWQSDATRFLHDIDSEVVVASPRKDYKPGNFVYEKQVDWEAHFLNRAAKYGAVLFWLAQQAEDTPGRAYAQTSRFELGEWKMRHQSDGAIVVVGIEKGFGNERYIRRRLSQDCPDIPILDNLVETCETTVNLVKDIDG